MTQGNQRWNFLVMVFLVALFASDAVAGRKMYSAGHHRDIEYARVNGEWLRLDAYVPESKGRCPVVICVHGGGWGSGDKEDMGFLCKPLVDAGFTCFSIGYRLAPAHRWPACIEDIRTAIGWIREHAADYKGDPERAALMGYSAGGHLACFAATRFADVVGVQAVVGLAAPTDLVADIERRGGMSIALQNLFDRPEAMDDVSWELLRENSPVEYVQPGLPPFLLVHGTEDRSVPYEQSVDFRAGLMKHDIPCTLVTIDGAPHRISEWEEYDPDYKAQIVDWLAKTLGNRRTRTITVSADGTGDYTAVQAAIDAVSEQNTRSTVIRIKAGTYKEKIIIPHGKRFITFKGEDAKATVLTHDLSAHMKDEKGEELGTFRTPSVTIEADDFAAEHITFENSAGDVGQAVAVTVIGDRVVFRDCRFLGWQDTLLDQTGRHYYENCYIAGHCDFIFGGGTAFFKNCHIHCLEGSYITAASTPQHQAYGYVFSHCRITGEPEGSKTYLGRPWRDYASVIFLNTWMSRVVRPDGWQNWNKPHRVMTARYAEYNSTGPGAHPEKRVDWSRQLTAEEARKITMESVLAGDDGWNPLTGTVKKKLKIVPTRRSVIDSFRQAATSLTQDGSAYLFTACSREDGRLCFF